MLVAVETKLTDEEKKLALARYAWRIDKGHYFRGVDLNAFMLTLVNTYLKSATEPELKAFEAFFPLPGDTLSAY